MIQSLWKRPPADPIERRRDPRRAVVHEVAKLVAGDDEELCVVRDVSAAGLKAEIYRTVPKGAQVRVELQSGRSLSGEVAWARAGQIGITFADAVPMPTLLAQCSVDPRVGVIRLPRIAVDLPGVLRLGFDEYAARVINISQGGMRVAADAPTRAGARCEVATEALPFRSAAFAWWRGGEGGLVFDQPLRFEEFAAWRCAPGQAPTRGAD
jgi:hypothetical protein